MDLLNKRVVILLILFLVFLVSSVCTAETIPIGIQKEIDSLITSNKKKRKQIFLSLAKKGDPKLLPLLMALREGSLFIWTSPNTKKVVIAGDAVKSHNTEAFPVFNPYGKTIISNSKTPNKNLLIPESSLEEIRANRRLRRAIRPYILILKSTIQLYSKDPNIRRAASTRMARLGDPKSIPIIKSALEKETHWLSRNAFEEAIAIIQLKSASPNIQKNAAIKLGEIKGLNGLIDLKRITNTKKTNFTKEEQEVHSAVNEAIKKIESYKSWTFTIDTVFRGLSLGSILLLMALGLAVVFGLMGVINMAHGELMMFGAYSTFIVQGIFINYFSPDFFGYYFIFSLPAAFLVSATIGYLMEISIIRFLYGRPLETLLTTWGISLILQQLVRQIFGAQNVSVVSPTWLKGGYHVLVGVQFPYNRLFIVLLAILCVVGTFLFLFKTRSGMRIRAVTQNREMSSCLGVPSRKVDSLTFALGAGLAGLAGAALSQVGNVGPDLGQNYIVDSFMVVVTGGVGKIFGTIVAGLGLGGLNKFLEPWMGAVFGKVLILFLVIMFLQKRPEGLFSVRSRGA
ncbi:MAG: urea ABC transporter permease subunit UrtB [bacterium]